MAQHGQLASRTSLLAPVVQSCTLHSSITDWNTGFQTVRAPEQMVATTAFIMHTNSHMCEHTYTHTHMGVIVTLRLFALRSYHFCTITLGTSTQMMNPNCWVSIVARWRNAFACRSLCAPTATRLNWTQWRRDCYSRSLLCLVQSHWMHYLLSIKRRSAL